MRPRLSLFASVVAIVLVAACSEATNGVGMISQRLGQAVRNAGNQEVALASLTSFGWDRFYAFKPGVTREEVCRFIHAGRNACGRVIRIERAGQDQTFLVFALEDRVTHVELHALSNGEFDFPFPETGQPRDHAVFKVRRTASGAGETFLLEPR